MKPSFSLSGGLAITCLLSSTQAHTWLENLRLIASNGSFVGTPGYPRAFVTRQNHPPPDIASVYKLPPNGAGRNAFSPTDLMCSKSQVIGAQSPGFPSLVAAPEDNIALRYSENGHVTFNQAGRPAHGGMVFVYGTKKPSNTDTYLGIHRVWNAAGTGGDKRGRLLATRPYDDGQCYQVNGETLSAERRAKFPNPEGGNADLLCQTDVKIPADAGTSGQYTLYWVWEWPLISLTGGPPTNESYTACADIEMTSNDVKAAGDFIAKQPFNSGAIAVQLKSQFLLDPSASPQLTDAPPYTMIPSGAPASPSSAAPVVSSEPPASTPAAPGTSKPAGPASNSAPKGFITVTVTAGFQEKLKTVTVTDYVTIGSSQPPQASPKAPASEVTSSPVVISTSTATLIPLPASDFLPAPTSVPYTSFPATSVAGPSTTTPSSAASTSRAPSGPPPIRPFLPDPAQSQVEPSPSPSASKAASTIASQSSTPTTSEIKASPTSKSACTKTAPSTGSFTETATPHLNGSTPVKNNYRHRRRLVRV